MLALHNWYTIRIRYVLSFNQAPLEREIQMEIPKYFKINGGSNKDYSLKMHHNL